jgi:hypothetical protein
LSQDWSTWMKIVNFEHQPTVIWFSPSVAMSCLSYSSHLGE